MREADTEQLLSRGRKPGSAAQALADVQDKDRAAKAGRARAIAQRTASKGACAGKPAKPRRSR